MHILLAAATPFEIQPTIDYLASKAPAAKIRERSSPSPTNVHPLITGVGSLATTWSLMRQIDSQRPDLIIQAGIAGCFTGRKAGDVVVVREEALADLGVWEDQRFKTLFDLQLADSEAPPFSGGKLVNPYQQLLSLTSLDPVSAITVNEITTEPARIAWYQQNTAAVVESMEGGGLHYVCLREKIPFVQLRAVSNDIGVRDKTKWDIRSAIRNLNEQVISLLEKLGKNGTTF
ncbi:MAG TPA: futalosine hydrolase [Puia sp.]|nr:futalosine hydrolase [Puia sp.]